MHIRRFCSRRKWELDAKPCVYNTPLLGVLSRPPECPSLGNCEFINMLHSNEEKFKTIVSTATEQNDTKKYGFLNGDNPYWEKLEETQHLQDLVPRFSWCVYQPQRNPSEKSKITFHSSKLLLSWDRITLSNGNNITLIPWLKTTFRFWKDTGCLNL